MVVHSDKYQSREKHDTWDSETYRGLTLYQYSTKPESAPGRKERNACKETIIVFSIFHAQILNVKIVIGQN